MRERIRRLRCARWPRCFAARTGPFDFAQGRLSRQPRAFCASLGLTFASTPVGRDESPEAVLLLRESEAYERKEYGSDLHPLVTRAEALCAVARADRRFAGPALPLPSGSGLRSRSGVSAGRPRQLSAVHGAGSRG